MNDTDKAPQSKATASEQHKATTDQAMCNVEVKVAESIKPEIRPAPAKSDSSSSTRTKMDIATEVYKRMKRMKSVTRKEIIEQFVVEAKLSRAGASTYYQLIKAKVK